MAEFVAGNEDVNLSFMSFAQTVSIDIMPDGAAVDREIGMFTLQLGKFPDYTLPSKRLPSYYVAALRISSFIEQLNQVKMNIQHMRESSREMNKLYIANFKIFLLSLVHLFKKMQEHLQLYFQNAASAQGGGGVGIKENLKDPASAKGGGGVGIKENLKDPASAKGGGEKSHVELLKDLLLRMTTIVDSLQP